MICRNHVDVSQGVRRCHRCGSSFCADCLVDIGGKPYCATCKTEELLDVRSGVERGTLDLASIGRRFGAAFVDGLLLLIPITIMIVMLGAAQATQARVAGAWNFWVLIPTVIGIAYQALMLSARGQTLGKMAMKVKVVAADGAEITPGQAWGREITRSVLGFLYIVDYIPAFFTKEKTTLHDLAAKTRVVNWA
ncbi:MAG TPA: RDD family protein [Thermoanaerobaculia bacterium]|nr:RDD family protein [Thermoanaerobaculia bacterium]